MHEISRVWLFGVSVFDSALALIAAATANTLYYTLSTVAQTLSGAFALMAAFVVFKLQFTTTQIAEAARPVARAARLVKLAGKASSKMCTIAASRRFWQRRAKSLTSLR